jgi:hypothetical protein
MITLDSPDDDRDHVMFYGIGHIRRQSYGATAHLLDSLPHRFNTFRSSYDVKHTREIDRLKIGFNIILVVYRPFLHGELQPEIKNFKNFMTVPIRYSAISYLDDKNSSIYTTTFTMNHIVEYTCLQEVYDHCCEMVTKTVTDKTVEATAYRVMRANLPYIT